MIQPLCCAGACAAMGWCQEARAQRHPQEVPEGLRPNQQAPC